MKGRIAEVHYNGTEVDGWRSIAEVLTRALRTSVCVRTAQRYAADKFPTAEAPRPLPLGQRGNGVRFLRLDQDLAAWVEWFRGAPRERRRAQPGDRRRIAA